MQVADLAVQSECVKQFLSLEVVFQQSGHELLDCSKAELACVIHVTFCRVARPRSRFLFGSFLLFEDLVLAWCLFSRLLRDAAKYLLQIFPAKFKARLLAGLGLTLACLSFG